MEIVVLTWNKLPTNTNQQIKNNHVLKKEKIHATHMIKRFHQIMDGGGDL